MKLKKHWLRATLLVIILLVGGGFAYHTLGQSDVMKAAPFKPKLKPNGTELVVRGYQIPARSSSVSRFTFTGSLQPRFQSQVGFRVAGKIVSRHVEVGSQVKQGDLLFRLDPIDYELQLKMAEADLVSAEAQWKQANNEEARLQKLLAISAISRSEYDLAFSAKDIAQARVNSASKRLDVVRNQLEYCDLKADRDGLVVSLSGEVGQVVNTGQPVATLMQGSDLEVLVNIPENQVAMLEKSRASVSLWAQQEIKIPAELRELSPMADALTRTFDARFKLSDAADHRLSLGMTATVELHTEATDQLLVPMSAIAQIREGIVVWQIDTATGQVRAVPISVDFYQTDMAVIRADLKPGDWIVSAGVQRVDQEVRVRLWTEAQS